MSLHKYLQEHMNTGTQYTCIVFIFVTQYSFKIIILIVHKYISICFISTKKGWDLENVFWWKVLAENFGAGRHKEEEERRDSPAALGDHSTNLT